MAVDNRNLDEQLKSLRIERGTAPTSAGAKGTPKGLLLALSVLVVLVVFGYLYFFSAPKSVSAADVKVETGPAQASNVVLTVSGYIVAHHKIDVGSKVMGRVAWIGVEKGDKVIKGQVLVRLEDDEFRAQVAQAQANVAAAQARLDELEAGSRPEEKMRARAVVAETEANLKNAEADYTRIEQLFRQGGIVSRSELDRAVAQRDAARAAHENARQALRLAEIGPRAEQIRRARAELMQARAALDYSQSQLESTQIRAPVTGTVLRRIVELGAMATPSAMGGEAGARTSVVSLADLNDLQVELDISQTDFAKLRMGQRGEIIPDAFPNLRYWGRIAEISPEADRAKATVQVKVKVENPDDKLRPEMNARVNFLAADEPVVSGPGGSRVLVPKVAVLEKGDAQFVFVIREGKVQQRVVRVGEAQGDFFVVLDGLSGGETVVTSGGERLSDGDRVEVKQ